MMLNTLFAALAGAFTWTLLEYVIHRWLGHHRSLVGNPFGVEHTAHHSKGNYFAPTWKKIGVAVLIAALLIVPATYLLGLQEGAAYVLGLMAFYGYYELLHRMEHVHAGIGAYGRWARKHHFYHHFHDPSMNHGVTSPIWDVVFGTLVRADVIEVPPKLAMAWLVDPSTGALRPEFEGSYKIRAKRTGGRKPAPPAHAKLPSTAS